MNLTKIKLLVHPSGGLIATGAQNGDTILLSPSDNLVQVQRNEKLRCNHLFEREARREKILEARQRELMLKERERSGKGVREDEESKRK